MVIESKIDELLKEYNPSDNYNYESAIKEAGIKIQFIDKEKDLEKIVEELPKSLVITNKGFVENYLKKINLFDNKQIYTTSIAHINEVDKIEKLIKNQNNPPSLIIGFGGGIPIDISKLLAKRLDKNLLIVPTASSHDGHISGNSSLYENGLRRTKSSMQPKRVIVPLYLWESSADLKKAGRSDVLANIISLQDLSLAKIRDNYEINPRYISYSLEAVKILLNEKDMNDLARALFLSGLAMKETSRYCSGSEHELERVFAESKLIKGKGFFHGQLAGLSALFSAKVYEKYSDKFTQDLFFDSQTISSELVEIFRKRGILEYVLKPLDSLNSNKNVLINELRKVSDIRPSRYTLWNEVNSKSISWKEIIEAISSSHSS